jgi:diguanylate cyclase (GGDEF)-like protein
VPLVTRGRVLGLMTLAAEECDVFDEEALRLTTAVADYVALAIQNAFLYEETREAAIRDPLTRTYTRYWFVPFAERQIEVARRDGTPLSLIVFDLDHFKALNDSFGHPAGDQVLQNVVEAVADTLRSSNPVCRLGGEEFGVLLPGVSPEHAVGVAERLCRAVAECRHQCCPDRTVTISAGVGWLGEDCDTYEDLISTADRALYRAKRTGRNRAAVYDPGRAAPES